MSGAPRIAPGTARELGPVNFVFTRVAGIAMRTNPPNLFTTLGRHRGLMRGWLRFAGRMMPFGKLPRRDTELVILRVSHLRGADYERTHHEHLGRRAGLTAEEIERTKTGPEAPGWNDRERAILTAVDELHTDRDISDATWATLTRHLDERGLIELVMLAAHYEMLATFLHTLRIATDRRAH